MDNTEFELLIIEDEIIRGIREEDDFSKQGNVNNEKKEEK